jgi:hypothetical protein
VTAGAHVSIQYGGFLGIAHTNNILQNGSIIDVNNRGILAFQKDGDLNPILNNYGTIKINSGTFVDYYLPNNNDFAYLRADGCIATLEGHGSVVLGGGYDSSLTAVNGGSFINTGDHTIRGAGNINAPLVNYGKLVADNGTLALNQPVVNVGRLIVEGGTLQANQPVTGNGGVFVNSGQLNIFSNLQTNNMFLGRGAGIFVASNQTVEIMGNFAIAMINEQDWVWQDGSTLLMSGGTLEVAGHIGDGLFSNNGNFSIPHLIISGSVSLVDLRDNENHSSPEALYVGALDILAGSTLNLNDQLLFLQISPDVFHQIFPGDPMFANVNIINQTVNTTAPLPSTVFLMGTGLLSLANYRRRLRKK